MYVPLVLSPPTHHPTLLGHHREPGGAPFVMQQLATANCFTHNSVYMLLLVSQFVLCFLWERGSFSFPLSSGGGTRSSQSLLQHPPLFWPSSQRIGRCEWCRPRDGGELKAGLPENWDFYSGHSWQRIFAGGQHEELRPWQKSWGRRLGIRKGVIKPQETPCSRASTPKPESVLCSPP